MPSQATATLPSTGSSASPVRPAQAQPHAIVAERIDADAGVAEDDPLRADPLAGRGEQDRLQVGAVDRELRHVVTGPATRGLAVDVLAEAVEERRFARDHRAPLELAENAERGRAPRSRAAGR